MLDKLDKRIAFRVSSKLHRDLARLAEHDKRGLSDFVRLKLEQYVADAKKGATR